MITLILAIGAAAVISGWSVYVLFCLAQYLKEISKTEDEVRRVGDLK